MVHGYDVAIIGAGVAGLACAIRLQNKGLHVIVFEKNSSFGGKLSRFSKEGYSFDKGPSLFTEPELVNDLFSSSGRKPADYFEFIRMNESCRYFFKDGSQLIFGADVQTTSKEISSLTEKKDGEHFVNYLSQSKKAHERFGDYFISNPKPKWNKLLNKELIERYPYLLGSAMRKTLHQYNASRFSDERLVKIFDRFATYNGSDPYQTSGIYHMIPHLETNLGTYFPANGMRHIAEALYSLATEIGITFELECNPSVTGKGDSFIIKTNQEYSAKKLVCAIDHLTFYQHVYPQPELFKRFSRQERSSSGLVLYLGVKKRIEKLGLHNILFSKDYKKEFEQIFIEKKLPDDPTLYIHISQRAVSTDAPENCDNYFVMVNVPAGIEITVEDRERIKKVLFDRISEQFGVDIKNEIEVEEFIDPKVIEQETGSVMGALYGAASNQFLSPLRRHDNQLKDLPNVYFCGGTVHPGGGIPLVLRSARIVANLIEC